MLDPREVGKLLAKASPLAAAGTVYGCWEPFTAAAYGAWPSTLLIEAAKVPAWAAAVVAFFATMSAVVYFKNRQLADELAPKVEIRFDPAVCFTSEEGSITGRLIASNRSGHAIKDCEVRLTRVQHIGLDGIERPTPYVTPLNLSWCGVTPDTNPEKFSRTQLSPGDHQFDVIASREDEMVTLLQTGAQLPAFRVRVQVPAPRMEHIRFFTEPGTYRLTVQVSAPTIAQTEFVVLIEWTGAVATLSMAAEDEDRRSAIARVLSTVRNAFAGR